MRYEIKINNTLIWFEMDDNLVKDLKQKDINILIRYLNAKSGNCSNRMIENNTYDVEIRESIKIKK